MTARTGHGFNSSRFAVSVLALAALLAAFSFVSSSTGYAQEQERIGLLNRLFGSKKAEREEPKAQVVKPKTQRKKAPRAPAEGEEAPQVAVVTKHPNAHVVLVVGDFLASGLAEGLTTAFTQNPNVRIVDRSSGSSGFVRSDFHNWAEKVNELITSEKPAAVVVMIGANDRQQMLVDGVRETVRSENWNRQYADRAEELAKAIAARKVPFLWVGTPPFKSQKMMLDMLAFNEMYRTAAVGAGGEFVDVWDGFVDENGAYVASGPDINGQPARLRANDGINLARPGKRKIAFYAEKPLYRILGEDPAAQGAATADLAARPAYRMFGPFGPSDPLDQAELDVAVDPNEAGPVNAARPVALRTPGLDGGVELLGAIAEPRREAKTPAEKLAIEGFAPAAPAGRADQFGWPQLASAAGAMRELSVDTTRNKASVPAEPREPVVDKAAIRSVRANVLSVPELPMPGRLPPDIVPDRIEEVSPLQAAPDVAAAEPPMTTPSTMNKGSVPDFARGDPLDLSPVRNTVPRQAIKRPTSIGPEPNRAPTAVPKPVQEFFEPAETGEEIPSASLDGSVLDAGETKPALPDTAPPRAPAPSILPEATYDGLGAARMVPIKADPVPVASLPGAKDAPSELLPASKAPLVVAPNAPVEPAADLATAKAVPAIETGEVTGSAPLRSAPLSEAVSPATAPERAAPNNESEATDEAPTAAPVAARPEPVATEGAPSPLTESGRPADADTAAMPSAPRNSATPVAPAPPTILAEQPESGSGSTTAPDAVTSPADSAPPAQAPEPAEREPAATPPAPATPSTLPKNADNSAPVSAPDQNAVRSIEPSAPAAIAPSPSETKDESLTSITAAPASSGAIARP
ncbi:DUF459 domain-containing protein [Mesorhizobium sp. VNQ89]|uniref:SGNH/GDSL hydrolase family protein n=1 Tax=Mesorhizobium quangtriensis TaxID=3157709 RepID=UPI0032B78DA9